MKPIGTYIWSILSALLGNQLDIRIPLKSRQDIEQNFLDSFRSGNIGWNKDYDWVRRNGYSQACLMNNLLDYKFILENADQEKFTECKSDIPTTILIQFYKVKPDKDITVLASHCACSTSAANNGTPIGKPVLETSFVIVKKLDGHNYYHFQRCSDKHYEMIDYYEFSTSYATEYQLV